MTVIILVFLASCGHGFVQFPCFQLSYIASLYYADDRDESTHGLRRLREQG